jgi:hypothetical protein
VRRGPGQEVPRDVHVENDENEDGDEEEDGDDEDEVELGPKVVHLRQADGRLGVVGVGDHGQDGCGKAKGKQPRDEAGQTSLALGPHDAGLFGEKIKEVRDTNTGSIIP